MPTVPERPPGANATAPPSDRVDLSDPSERARWLAGACEQVADVVAAGLDATSPPGQRMLGRRAAREHVADAERALRGLFAAVGLDLAEPSSTRGARVSASSVESAGELVQLDAAVDDIVHARADAEEETALQEMPLTGVLFLALMGTPGERAEIDPPLVLALRAVRATVDDWAHQRGTSTRFADVSFADLDLLTRRLDATIEIARRGALLAPGGPA